MYDKEIFFKVAGKQYSDDRLNVLIPRGYEELFDGYEFKDMHHLSMALMHANCAEEALYYNRPWKLQEYENDLFRTLGINKQERKGF